MEGRMTRSKAFKVRNMEKKFVDFVLCKNGESVWKMWDLKTKYKEYTCSSRFEMWPPFGSVLYHLEQAGWIRIRGEDVRLFSMAQTPDQWHIRKFAQKRRIKEKVPNGPLIGLFPMDEGVDRDKALQLIKELKKNRNEIIKDKNKIFLTSKKLFKKGKIVSELDETFQLKFTGEVSLHVENKGESPVSFTSYFLLLPCKRFSLSDEDSVKTENPKLIKPGDRYEVLVNFSCSNVGAYQAPLAFEFKLAQQPSSAPFYIVRFIEFHCISAFEQQLTDQVSNRFSPRSVPPLKPGRKVKNGQRPPSLLKSRLKTKVPLKEYKIPWNRKDFIRTLEEPSNKSQDRESLENPLRWKNYKKKLDLLLYLEEDQMNADMKKYNIPAAVLKRDPNNEQFLILKLPDLSENRPSVQQGDKLEVYPEGADRRFVGYVHSVQRDSVKLSFHRDLLGIFTEQMKFTVKFHLNRLTLRIEHRAAEMAEKKSGLKGVLFPSTFLCSNQNTELPELKLSNPQVKENPQQYQAVQHIVAGSSKPAPYLIFGPPGTGKTVTMVEAIVQIEKQKQASCHILACAHTNSAVDLLFEKILEHVEGNVRRLYAKTLPPESIKDELKEHSNLFREGIDFPAREELMEYKIIVTTLYTASRLVTGGIPAGHFTHVFVDEAGHATESECLIPLAGLLEVVLAGDPKQLGPVVRSPYAKQYGMGVSLLERLMGRYPEKSTDSSCYVTKLLRNYRSHPAILKIPNQLFYNGELQAFGEPECYSYCSWKELPQKDFPVIFHEVMGVEQREDSSPSIFNLTEVKILMDYVNRLLQAEILPENIGIITPYKRQVLKIRKALQLIGENSGELKVGSVEEFQGLERKVILVSTVRSTTDCLQIEKPKNLDFIKDDKRFNVALTRAKALLIVVGNSNVLNNDEKWAKFIQYCKDNKAYRNPEE